jgi:hypothetical protein
VSRLADALATLRDAAEAIAPAVVEERRQHVEETLRFVFGDFPRRAPRNAFDAAEVVDAMRSERTRLEAEVEKLRAEVAALLGGGK